MSWEIRTKFLNISNEKVELERVSKEFRIKMSIDFSVDKDKMKPKSGIKLVDGVLKNADFTVDIYKNGIDNRLMVENIGFALGEGLRKLHKLRKAKETGSFIQTDKKKMCMFAINAKKQFGEANLQIIGKPKFEADWFFAFFDGFAQGFGSEINAVINLAANDRDHLEFVSKAFAGSLKGIFA